MKLFRYSLQWCSSILVLIWKLPFQHTGANGNGSSRQWNRNLLTSRKISYKLGWLVYSLYKNSHGFYFRFLTSLHKHDKRQLILCLLFCYWFFWQNNNNNCTYIASQHFYSAVFSLPIYKASNPISSPSFLY